MKTISTIIDNVLDVTITFKDGTTIRTKSRQTEQVKWIRKRWFGKDEVVESNIYYHTDLGIRISEEFIQL